MNFNPRKLFVIAGYPHTGKMKTTRHIFQRKHFFPFKGPIKAAGLDNREFIVINISDHNFRTEHYLLRIKAVMQCHVESRAAFLVVLSVIFDDSARDVKKILTYFNQSGFDIHYLVLYGSWRDKRVIGEQDLLLLSQQITQGAIHVLDRLVTKSELRFNQRAEELRLLMVALLGEKG
jgi:hypothetical protein